MMGWKGLSLPITSCRAKSLIREKRVCRPSLPSKSRKQALLPRMTKQISSGSGMIPESTYTTSSLLKKGSYSFPSIRTPKTRGT
jgi:hypothetical protein